MAAKVAAFLNIVDRLHIVLQLLAVTSRPDDRLVQETDTERPQSDF